MFRSIVSKENLKHEEWLEYRRNGIGGSDAAAICGLNPYKSPMAVWLEKTGQAEPENVGEAAYWGNILEPLIMEEFGRRTGLDVGRELSILQHEKHSFMIANLDGIAFCRERNEAFVFEAKTANSFSASLWENGVPEHYQLQVQHYMAVTGYSGTYVGVLIGGQNFKHFYIPRDEEIIGMLIELEKRFWNYVVTNTPPPIDGSIASTSFISKLYPVAKDTSITLPDESLALIEQYEEAVELEKQATEKKDAAANKLKEMLKENDTGIINGRVVSWKTIESERLDTKRFKQEQPELYSSYSNKSTYRRFTIK